MATPQRHRDSGIYWYRRKVPADLRALVGKTEVKQSLGTRDPAAARVEFAKVAAEIEAKWASLRQGVQPISHRQAVAVAGEIYHEIVATYGDNPENPEGWKTGLVSDQAMFTPKKVRMSFVGNETLMRNALERARASFYMDRVEEFLQRRGMLVGDGDKRLIHKAVGEAIVQAREQLHRMAGGDYRPDPNADRFPEFVVKAAAASTKATPASEPSDRYSPVAIFAEYAEEAKLAAATLKAWRRMIAKVATAHPDIRTIDKAWCIQWKDALLASGLSANTVNDGYLSALRAVCGWAVANGRIRENPVQGVAVKRRKKPKLRSKGYTDEEAALVLKAALQPVTGRMAPENMTARRWVPWLCAYTGARVGEIGQLRKKDIILERGVHLVHITPEAGSTKNEQAREVAIHPHLIEQGFLKFVRSLPEGPLFYNPARQRGGSVENPQSKKVGERLAKWVRSLGIIDPVVRPNHAWRHRFKTLSRRHKLDAAAVTYMQGHAYKTEGDKYGEFEPAVLLAEISMLPAYRVT